MANWHKKLILGAFAAILSLGVYASCNSPVFADSSEKKPIHMQIEPAKQKIKLEPGQSYVGSMKIKNIGSKQFSYTMAVYPYTVVDVNYNPNYENLADNYTKIANWITFDEKDKTGSIEPGASVDVPYTITVPKDVPSGGQYAAITAETSDGNNSDSAIKTVNRLAMILYADIAGDTKTSGSIINNSVNSFVFNPPITVSAMIENTGNVETTASCVVKIWPLGSTETVFNNEQDRGRLIDIIPGTRRYNAISWGGSPSLGIFTVEQTIEYLGQTSVVKKLVIICPLWLIVIIFLIVAILIFWLVYRATKRRNAKKDQQNINQEDRRI